MFCWCTAVWATSPWQTRPPDSFANNLAELIELRSRGPQLDVVTCDSNQTAMNAARLIIEQQQSMSSSGGDGFWSCLCASSEQALTATRGNPHRQSENLMFQMQFADRAVDGCRLEIRATEADGFSLLAFNKPTPDLILFQQTEKGAVRFVTITPERLESGVADNFEQLIDQNDTAAGDLLLPQLRQWGVCALTGKKSRVVRDLMLLRLRPLGDDPEWTETLRKLDSTKYSEREEASAWLVEHGSDRLAQILGTLDRSDVSSEVLKRLRNVLKDSLSARDFETLQFEQNRSALEDPSYLLWLAEQLDSRQELPSWLADDELYRGTLENLFSRLRATTHQSLPDSLEDWRTWIVQSQPALDVPSQAESANPANNPASIELAAPPAHLVSSSAYLRDLLPLTIREGQVTIDKDHWRALFAGKSAQELAADLRAFLEERHLPPSWLALDSKQLDQVDFPQILFQRMEDAVNSAPQNQEDQMWRQQMQMMRMHMPVVRNRKFSTPEWAVALEVDEAQLMDIYGRVIGHSKNNEKRDDVLLVNVWAEQAPGWQLLVGWWPDRQFRLVVVSESDLIQIFSTQSGTLFFDVATPSADRHREYTSGEQLLEDELFASTVRPWLEQCGVIIRTDGD